jgi:hypothetical protein
MHGAVASIAIAALFGCKYQSSAEQDAAPRVGVGFQFTNSLTDESVNTHRVSIGLASPSMDTVTVEIRIDDSGSADEADFSLLTPTVTFLAGQTQADVELSITNDGVEEPDETIELRFGEVQNAVVVHDSHRVTISSDFLPRVTFMTDMSNASEDPPAQRVFAVVLDIPADVDVVVGYGFTGNAAGGGVDHSGADNTLTIPVGMLSYDLAIDIVDDEFDEFDETFAITLTAQSGAVIGAIPIHTHQIDDEDPEPTVTFAAPSSSGNEDGGAVALDAVLTPAASGKGVTVQCSATNVTAGSGDYAVSGCPITFPPYVDTRSITVTPMDDGTDEENETLDVTLTSADTASVGAQDTHVFSITDDDASPDIEFSSASSTTPEDGGGFNLTVTKSEASERVVQFSIAVTGGSAGVADYTVSAGPYQIPIGMMSVNVAVSITSDNLDESNENFTLGFTSVTAAQPNGTTSHTGTITDDDVGASWTTAGISPNEGNGSGTNTYDYDVTLDASSSKTVTMTVTLTGSTANGTDGSVSPTSLTFNPGDTVETVTVTVNRDNSPEGDDTFVMTLIAGSYVEIKSPATVTHTIDNDD